MKKFTSFFLLAFLFNLLLDAQTLVSAEFLGSKTKAELAAQLGNPLFKFGAEYFKIIYLTPKVDGSLHEATGYLAIPDDYTKIYPLLCYQHGTSSSVDDVPSNLNFESNLPLSFAGMGFVTVAPDYIGLGGSSEAFHPYVHAETEASAGRDLLIAARELASQQGFHLNDQVFVTGYSQGGHASAALHRSLQEDFSGEFGVVAASHMSGPYSISGVMRDQLLAEETYGNPAYLVNTLFSYQYVYGNLFDDLADAVKPAYVDMTQQFFDGEIGLGQLNAQLIAALTANEGAPIPVKMFQDDFVAAVLGDDNHPVNVALRANDVYDWTPASPTRLFYCTADDQVPFENSVEAEAAMLLNGAADLVAIDVNSSANHTACVTPAVLNTILFFLQYQAIGDVVATAQTQALPLDLFPNPAGDVVFLKNFPAEGMLSIRDLSGRVLLQRAILPGDQSIDVQPLADGLYLLEVAGAGQVWRQKLVVK